MRKFVTYTLLIFFAIPIHAQVKPKPIINNLVLADTVIVMAVADTSIIPFEPYETNYQSALKVAKSTKERTNVLKPYVDALFSSTLIQDHKKALLKKKIEQYISIDFYSLYECFLLVSKEKDNAKPLFFIGVFRSIATDLQWNALTEYMKYVTEAAQMLVYNQTTGQTEQLKKPTSWPVGLPLPGYGWGKYTSTDDVATPVSMQYHLSAEERYTIISQYKKDGKKISLDDQAWHTAYEVNNVKQKQVSPNNKSNDNVSVESKLKYLVGRYYSYETATMFNCTTCKVIGYTNKDDITLQCKYGTTLKATYDELENNKGLFGYHPATAQLERCKSCRGNGVVKTTFSHTNDYQYTLGKKITYTSSSVSKCSACDGSGYKDIY